jgi:hypothetical protein
MLISTAQTVTDRARSAVFRVNQAPEFAKTTATYTVTKEKEDLPALFWDDGLEEWVIDPHPPEESTS